MKVKITHQGGLETEILDEVVRAVASHEDNGGDTVVDVEFLGGEQERYHRAGIDWCVPYGDKNYWKRIKEFNSLFSYEQEEDLKFWADMMEHQVEEIKEHLENGEDEEVSKEFIDCILVGQQAIISATNENVDDRLIARIEDIGDRIEDVQDAYETGTEEQDLGVASTGYICQNLPAHPDEEIEMVNDTTCVVCPECGRRAGGPDDEIPYGDPDPRDNLAMETVECWRCGEQRYTYESCMNCGGSCKPSKKRKQKEGKIE